MASRGRGVAGRRRGRLRGDEEADAWLAGGDPAPIVTSLTWLGERLYYLASTDTPPFDDETTLVDVLSDAWGMALYGRRAGRSG